MLEARNLAIGYGATAIGSGLRVDVRGGDILCLLGPNGCGKTTLFRTLLGLLPALSGTVTLGAKPIAAQTRAAIARQVAYVPQAHVPPFPYEALDVVLMGRAGRLGLFGQPGRRDREVARGAMTRLGIEALAHRDYSRLSGGQRQLVLSTHDPDQAFALDARVLMMKDGRIHADGRAEDVLTETALSAVYGIPVSIEKTPSGRKVCLASPGRRSASAVKADAESIA